MQIHTDSHPRVIVLGVTPGYALKLKERIPNKGNFFNPGSAGEFVCLSVFRQSLDMGKCKLYVRNRNTGMYSVFIELYCRRSLLSINNNGRQKASATSLGEVSYFSP